MVLLANAITAWYISCLISNTLESPVSIQNLWFSQLIQLVDSAHLVVYMFLNNYIWPSGAFMWCFVPKIFWTIIFAIIWPDVITDLITILLVASITNLIHVLACEEAMVNFKDSKQGSTLQAYSLTQMNPSYMLKVAWVSI